MSPMEFHSKEAHKGDWKVRSGDGNIFTVRLGNLRRLLKANILLLRKGNIPIGILFLLRRCKKAGKHDRREL